MSQELSVTLAYLREFDDRYRGGGNEERYLCPWCGGHKRRDAGHRSLCVAVQSGAFICHRCGLTGKLDQLTNLPDPAILLRQRKIEAAERLANFHSLAKTTESLSHPMALKYLEKRGICYDLARRSQIKFCKNWRGTPAIVFPIRDKSGRLVAAQGRYVYDSGSIKHCTMGDKLSGVFASYGGWAGDYLVLTEAPFDAMSLSLAGYAALSLCGSGLQPFLLLESKRFIVATDGDSEGLELGQRWRNLIRAAHGHADCIHPQSAKDWNEVLLQSGVTAVRREFGDPFKALLDG